MPSTRLQYTSGVDRQIEGSVELCQGLPANIWRPFLSLSGHPCSFAKPKHEDLHMHISGEFDECLMNAGWMFERILYDPLQRKFSRAILFVDVTTPIRPHQAWSLRGQGLSRPICLTEFLIAAAESTQASFNKNCSNKLRLKWISRIWRTEKTSGYSGSIWPWPGHFDKLKSSNSFDPHSIASPFGPS